MRLEEIELRIQEIYRWFHQEAPGTRPRETGELGELWSLFDNEVAEQ